MFKLFKSKQQEESLKSIPTLDVEKHRQISLKLTRLNMTFSISQTLPYQAVIEYAERPTNWNDPGVLDSVRIVADSWPELLDKVNEHFHETL